MNKQLIDEDILKCSVENAYNLGFEAGMRKGKMHALHALVDNMRKQNIKEIPGSLIVELMQALGEEKENE